MLHIEIVTPEGVLYSAAADSISLPTPDGEITILPHHIPLISSVAPGGILIRHGKEEFFFAVSRGAVEIDGTTVHVIVDSADRAEELEEQVILEAKAKAEALQKERRGDLEGFAEATAALERELAKLQVVRRPKPGRSMPPASQ